MRHRVVLTLALLALLLPAPAAWAQLKGIGYVGVTVTTFSTPDSDVGSETALGFTFGLRPRAGWGPTFGFGWFTGGLDAEVSGRRVEFGELSVRPIMGGVAYTWLSGRWVSWVEGLAGYSFNSGSLRSPYDSGGARFDVADSFTAKAGVGVIYALAPRVGLTGSAGYLVMRPDITLDLPTTAGSVRYTNNWKADAFYLGGGVVFSLF